MKGKHRAILEKKMDELINEIGKDGEVWIGEELSVCMTRAAEAVFDSTVDHEKYLKQEGHLE